MDNWHADPDNQPDIEDMHDCAPPDVDPSDTFDQEVHDHGTPGTIFPTENMVLTIAMAQIQRGKNPGLNTTAVLAWALVRLSGRGGEF